MPTLIRVYGIVLTLVLLLIVVDDRQSSLPFETKYLQHALAMGTRRDHGGGHDLRDPDRRLRPVGCVGLLALRGRRRLCRTRLIAPRIAFAAAIAVGLLFGLANGLLVAVVRINPFITTVGSGFIINGVALVMTQNAAFLVDN